MNKPKFSIGSIVKICPSNFSRNSKSVRVLHSVLHNDGKGYYYELQEVNTDKIIYALERELNFLEDNNE